MLSKKTLVQLSALATLTIAAAETGTVAQTPKILAQASPTPEFPLPRSLPSNATVKVDGSSSMSVINAALKQRFEEKFPGTKVELGTKGTDAALKEVLDGNATIAAIGRALTPAEKEKGLVEVPISREKIAVIVGPDNPFQSNLTFEQFAKIFRGEITDWSQVGGTPGPIRFVDRPEFSDTRRALRNYDVFKAAPFQTGATATAVGEDDTAAVVKELGKDGISYAIASQVLNQSNVRVLQMHKTLPDNPKYPYSQPRGYAYKKGTAIDPATAAFLGFATSEPGKEIVEAAKTQEAEAVSKASPDAEKPSPAPAVTASPQTQAAAPVAVAANNDGTAKFPWWLLAIPLLGGLLWWLFKDRGTPASVAPAPAPRPPAPVPTPPPPTPASVSETVTVPPVAGLKPETTDGIATDAVPPTGGLKLGDAAPIAGAAIAGAAGLGAAQALSKPAPAEPTPGLADLHPVPAERDADMTTVPPVGGLKPAGIEPAEGTIAEESVPPVGGLKLENVAPIAAAAGAVGLGAAALAARPIASMTLALRDREEADADWDVPEALKAEARQQGGRELAVRLYDVTGVDLDQQPPCSMQQFDCGETDINRLLPIAQVDRDYVAEVGYVTDDGRWLKLARSNSVRVAPLAAAAVTPAVVPASDRCSIQDVTVHSKANCYLLNADEMRHIEEQISVTQPLEPGSYLVRIKEGSFDYKEPENHPGEPWVLLWIHGGKVVNQKTDVPVTATWSTLNGYDETLALDVQEPARLHAFFFDTHKDDNEGEVTVSVIRIA